LTSSTIRIVIHGDGGFFFLTAERNSRPLSKAAAAGLKPYGWIRPAFVFAAPGADEEQGELGNVFDLDGPAHNDFGLLGQTAIILIRPDGHIAFRCSADALEALQNYTDRITRAA
jgi:hypothetical protein